MALNETFTYDTEIRINESYIVIAVQNMAILIPGLFLNILILVVCLRPNKMPARFRLIVLGTTICNFTGMIFSMIFMTFYIYHYVSQTPSTFFWCGLWRRAATYMSLPSMNIVIVTSIDRYLHICRNIRVRESRIVLSYIVLHVIAIFSVLVHIAYGGVSHEISCGPTISAPRYFHVFISFLWFTSIVVAFGFALKTMMYLVNYERANKISGNFLRTGSWKEVLGRRPTVKRRIGQREVHVQKSIIMGIFIQGVLPLITVVMAATLVVNIFQLGRDLSFGYYMLFGFLYYSYYILSPLMSIIFGGPLRRAIVDCFKPSYEKLKLSTGTTNKSQIVAV
ncbi:hypothetical protein L596_023277 [Steinernema carpocapsae]|uniref:G-protein coupled receptors family 1 profile domain-containing protein n=1 Tax=Steinernema carpocapsae TaxID=34508 RepID=A0A4U5MD62_STECR|nr:hypothetical protein L596_023277 [Steinernema carpocapsae]